jgi:hypothetical protein
MTLINLARQSLEENLLSGERECIVALQRMCPIRTSAVMRKAMPGQRPTLPGAQAQALVCHHCQEIYLNV